MDCKRDLPRLIRNLGQPPLELCQPGAVRFQPAAFHPSEKRITAGSGGICNAQAGLPCARSQAVRRSSSALFADRSIPTPTARLNSTRGTSRRPKTAAAGSRSARAPHRSTMSGGATENRSNHASRSMHSIETTTDLSITITASEPALVPPIPPEPLTATPRDRSPSPRQDTKSLSPSEPFTGSDQDRVEPGVLFATQSRAAPAVWAFGCRGTGGAVPGLASNRLPMLRRQAAARISSAGPKNS